MYCPLLVNTLTSTVLTNETYNVESHNISGSQQVVAGHLGASVNVKCKMNHSLILIKQLKS